MHEPECVHNLCALRSLATPWSSCSPWKTQNIQMDSRIGTVKKEMLEKQGNKPFSLNRRMNHAWKPGLNHEQRNIHSRKTENNNAVSQKKRAMSHARKNRGMGHSRRKKRGNELCLKKQRNERILRKREISQGNVGSLTEHEDDLEILLRRGRGGLLHRGSVLRSFDFGGHRDQQYSFTDLARGSVIEGIADLRSESKCDWWVRGGSTFVSVRVSLYDFTVNAADLWLKGM